MSKTTRGSKKPTRQPNFQGSRVRVVSSGKEKQSSRKQEQGSRSSEQCSQRKKQGSDRRNAVLWHEKVVLGQTKAGSQSRKPSHGTKKVGSLKPEPSSWSAKTTIQALALQVLTTRIAIDRSACKNVTFRLLSIEENKVSGCPDASRIHKNKNPRRLTAPGV